eukprot:8577840-Alexandrium_andersonii.AAC.1
MPGRARSATAGSSRARISRPALLRARWGGEAKVPAAASARRRLWHPQGRCATAERSTLPRATSPRWRRPRSRPEAAGSAAGQ